MKVHQFAQGGTIGSTFYIFCTCGWGTSVEASDAMYARTERQIEKGRKALQGHISDAYAEENAALMAKAAPDSTSAPEVRQNTDSPESGAGDEGVLYPTEDQLQPVILAAIEDGMAFLVPAPGSTMEVALSWKVTEAVQEVLSASREQSDG